MRQIDVEVEAAADEGNAAMASQASSPGRAGSSSRSRGRPRRSFLTARARRGVGSGYELQWAAAMVARLTARGARRWEGIWWKRRCPRGRGGVLSSRRGFRTELAVEQEGRGGPAWHGRRALWASCQRGREEGDDCRRAGPGNVAPVFGKCTVPFTSFLFIFCSVSFSNSVFHLFQAPNNFW